MAGLNPTQSGDSHNWNYSRPHDPGYSLTLLGTVKAIQMVQAMNFSADGRPSTPKFWDNNPTQPMMNIRLVICGPKGGFRTWTITPASKAAKEGKKPSVHIDLFNLAGGQDILNLVEKTIKVETKAPPAGFNYGVGNPRPWKVELVTDQGPFQLAEPLDPIYLLPEVYGNMAVSGGTMHAPVAAAPAAQASPQPTTEWAVETAFAPDAQPAAEPEDGGEDIPF